MSVERIQFYFPNLTANQVGQIRQLLPIYEYWNSKINVISRKDINHFYERHVLHSLGIAKVIELKSETKLLDVGTGGGFPGIPLAIMFPDCQFHLVDSIGKKVKVVQAVANELGLQNVRASHVRAENVTDKYDFIISRAVTRLKPFYQWVKGSLLSESKHWLDNGILYLKGGDLDEELAEAKKPHSVHNLSKHFSEEFFETKKLVHVPVH